jgi:hypothetical protein
MTNSYKPEKDRGNCSQFLNRTKQKENTHMHTCTHRKAVPSLQRFLWLPNLNHYHSLNSVNFVTTPCEKDSSSYASKQLTNTHARSNSSKWNQIQTHPHIYCHKWIWFVIPSHISPKTKTWWFLPGFCGCCKTQFQIKQTKLSKEGLPNNEMSTDHLQW